MLVKRPSRPSKERLRPTEYSYGPPKYVKTISELVKKCQKVLQLVQKHEFAQPFLKPVDYLSLNIPDYPIIVKEPMDLSKVDKKLRGGSYSNPMQFAADMRKIWSNAILYNPSDTPIHEMTLKISDYFEKVYQPVEENPFSDPSDDFLPPKIAKVVSRLEELKNNTPDKEWQTLVGEPLSYGDKLALLELLTLLPPEHFGDVREILTEQNESFKLLDDIEIDLTKLNTTVLRKLERYLKNKSSLTARYSKKLAARTVAKKVNADRALLEENDEKTLNMEQVTNTSVQDSEDIAAGGLSDMQKILMKEEDENNDNRTVSDESSFFTGRFTLTLSALRFPRKNLVRLVAKH